MRVEEAAACAYTHLTSFSFHFMYYQLSTYSSLLLLMIMMSTICWVIQKFSEIIFHFASDVFVFVRNNNVGRICDVMMISIVNISEL